MQNSQGSTFYFIGRLSPSTWCKNFNPGELHFGDGYVLDVFQELVSIWVPGTDQPFEKVRNQALEHVDTCVSLFSFLTNKNIDFRITNWIEAKETDSQKNTIGYFQGKENIPRAPSKKNKDNIVWRKISKDLWKVEDSFFHKAALKDYKNFKNASGDDAFFYAYRILENIRRAATNGSDEWNKMHKILGTKEAQIKPLTDVSTKVRHGEFNCGILLEARQRKEEIVNIAIDIMKLEFKRSFKGLISH